VIDASEVERYQVDLADVYQSLLWDSDLEEIGVIMIVNRDDDK
jgi:hypothetical protein